MAMLYLTMDEISHPIPFINDRHWQLATKVDKYCKFVAILPHSQDTLHTSLYHFSAFLRPYSRSA